MKPKEIAFNGIIGKRNNVTIPFEVFNKYFTKTRNSFVLLLEIKNTKFYSNVSYQNFSYSLYLPKFITENLNLNSGDNIKIKIIDVIKKNLTRSDISKLNIRFLVQRSSIELNRSDQKYQNNFIKVINGIKYADVQKLLSDKIKIRNRTISFITKYISRDNLLISYQFDNINRKSKSVIIRRYIPLYPFAQFLGFYIGDGTTTPTTGSVSFINTAKDVVEWNMNFMKIYFKSKLKYRLVYGPTEPNKKISEKLKKNWSEIGIKSFNWSINQGYKNPSEFGAMRTSTTNMSLKLVMLKTIEEISKEATNNSAIAKFFLKGLAMSDMYPTTKNNILENISVAFKEGDKNSIELYEGIFKAYGIDAKKNSKRIKNTTQLSTYRMEDFIKMLVDDIFEFQNARKQKLIKGILNMDLFFRYFNRLKLFLQGPLTAYEFTKKSKLSDIPYEQLERLIKFGLLSRANTYPQLYFITSRGKDLLNKISNVS